tara:strand:- start:527 stop:1201 length:675 start_codon:yes stop_codon:yes gene_type:complete
MHARGSKAFGYCDRTGFRYPLKDLVAEVQNGVRTGLLVGKDVLDGDHPQNFVGRLRVTDPQSLRDPRPDNSVDSAFGYSPVGGLFTDLATVVGDVTIKITTTTTYIVTVVGGNPSNHPYYNFGSTNKFAIDGSTDLADVTLRLTEGQIYRFDQSDSSNSGHPLRLSTTPNGTHAGGVEYTTGVTIVGTPGSSGAYTQIEVAAQSPTLYYYCSNHSGMGWEAYTI